MLQLYAQTDSEWKRKGIVTKTDTLKTKEDLKRAAQLLREGELAAVPTETVYGLAGNGLDASVIERIYEVKGRPAVKPISLMVPGPEAMEDLCEAVPPVALALARRFWPGPLTIILKSKGLVPSVLRAGGSTVGLRCPRQKLTLSLLKQLEFPLAVPSANPSGKASPKTAGEVLDYFNGKIAAVIDGGPCELGLESTVLDLSGTPYRILRQGSLPAEEIADALVDEMQIIGITGGSGCGKTTVLYELKKCGALILDTDAIYHELLSSDRALIAAILEAFPEAVPNGMVDRKILGSIVFRDPDQLRKLNHITHGFISAELRHRLRDWAMRGGTLAAVDAVALHSSGEDSLCDWTIAVTASEETRIRRIMARDGISREAAMQRIRAQQSNENFVKLCDASIQNEGDLAALRMQLNQLLEEYQNHGRSERKSVFPAKERL